MTLTSFTVGTSNLTEDKIFRVVELIKIRTKSMMQIVVKMTLSMAISTQIFSQGQIVTVSHRPVRPVVIWELLQWVVVVCQICHHTNIRKINKKTNKLLLCLSKVMRLLHQAKDYNKTVWTWNFKLLDYRFYVKAFSYK